MCRREYKALPLGISTFSFLLGAVIFNAPIIVSVIWFVITIMIILFIVASIGTRRILK